MTHLIILISLSEQIFLKFITDFGPLAIFFFFYYNNDKNLSIAIPPLLIATIVALFIMWVFEKEYLNAARERDLITFFGGLTIYFNDPILYVNQYNKHFVCSNIIFRKILFRTILKKIMGKTIPLNDIGWKFLIKDGCTFHWSLLNEFIWRTQSEEFWVNFKVWGML